MSRSRSAPPVSLGVGLLVLAILLASASLLRLRDYEDERRAAVARLETAGRSALPAEQLGPLTREPDPKRIQTAVARILLAIELDPRRRQRLEASDPALPPAAEQLDKSRRLAAAVLAERPASWEASMVLGATTYLLRSLEQDRRLFTEAQAWIAPLERARTLAPREPEPARLLATAYLELWPALSASRRRTARSLLDEAFSDPAIFARLAEAWLEIAPDRQTALDAIPPDPRAWRHLRQIFVQRGDWEGFRQAWLGYEAALEAEVRDDLEHAETLRLRGDAATARHLYFHAAARLRPGLEGVAVLRQALAQAPPGLAGSASRPLGEWLSWVLELCLIDRCPLSTGAIERLAGLAEELPAPRFALAELEAGRLERAEHLERRAPDLWRPEWGPYLMAKARHLLERGEPEAARRTLERLPAAFDGHPIQQALEHQLARRGTHGALAAARSTPSMSAWSRRGLASSRIIWLPEETSHLLVTLSAVPGAGGVVEIRLDGARVDLVTVRTGDEIPIPGPLSAGLHLLTVEALAGRIRPGPVTAP